MPRRRMAETTLEQTLLDRTREAKRQWNQDNLASRRCFVQLAKVNAELDLLKNVYSSALDMMAEIEVRGGPSAIRVRQLGDKINAYRARHA